MPQTTIQLLNELRGLCFSDDNLRSVHHDHERGPTIDRMISYCAGQTAFQPGGANARVRMRLQFVRNGFYQRNVAASQ